MIAENATKSIEQAVCYELQNIVKVHGATYNSPHEAYAVFLKQLETAEDNIMLIKNALERVWIDIKANRPITNYDLSMLKQMTIALAEEAVQCAAVTDKIIETVK